MIIIKGPAKKGPKSRGRKKRIEKRKFFGTGVKKVRNLITFSKKERGRKSEEFISRVSQILDEKGEIIDYYPTASIPVLDRKRIDAIYQTKNGFYLIQVKSSKTGVDEHLFRQSIKGEMLIYPIARHSGESEDSIRRKLSYIFKNRPSFTRLPEWIEKALGLGGTEKRKKTVSPLSTTQRMIIDSNKREPFLRLVDALKVFEGVKKVKQVRVVLPGTSLEKRHIDVVCWTRKGIYLFDIHREHIVEEDGVKIFPLDLSWPRNEVKKILKKQPQQEFPLRIFGAIMDLE